MGVAIHIKGLTRKFGSKVAVNDLNLEVKQGEVYGFLGPNGAGKSTTIRMLVTLLAPTKGDALIMGHSITHDVTSVRLRIGVALQDAALDDMQTGREFLRLQGRLYGLSKTEVDAKVEQLRKLVDLADAFDKRIKTYSGGMKRRLDLAAALIHDPQVLFLDEPTTGLDPVSRARVWDEIRRLNSQGMTIFLTTQHMEEADQLAHRVGIISGGKLVAQGTPSELKKKVGEDLIIIHVQKEAKGLAKALRKVPHVSSVNVHGHEIHISSTDGSKVIGPVAVALSKEGVHVEQLTMRSPSLDDVFMEVTGNRIKEGKDAKN